MTRTTAYTVLPFDTTTASHSELEEGARLQQTVAAERVPEDPPTSIEALISRMVTTTPSEWRAMFAARDSAGVLVGAGFVGAHLNEPENAHIRWCEISVDPDHRRRGIGRALFGALVGACLGQSDDLTFMGQTSDRVPSGEAFCGALGAEAGLGMKTTQLDLPTIDRAALRSWAATATPGYRLELVTEAMPDALMAAFLDAANGMNDAPIGTMRFADERMTAEQVRERETWAATAGILRWTIVAVHEASGAGAGFTNVSYDPRVSHVVQQGGTAVIAGHRGHGIGLWMKAAMLERLLTEWPAARYVRTGNAHSNAQMLGINTQLGFRQVWSTTLWQLPLPAARAFAASEGATTTAQPAGGRL